ncbi:hypothetical protein [Desulfocurvus sp.]|jgi:hypothetical protein|uniref:hypothetical protein n=1 Tax=Desulfocurvus sp. TaxID=2871698 RepID=UPI0025BB1CF8|nr:hypothetical protein [Desulfocurvus sp.]MCK9240508.1 hypothetical protein [Desulfocurvus sp.]
MPALRRLAALAATLLLALACMGMGGLGDTGIINKIPEPDRHFTVTVVDVTDTSFQAEDFSVDGQTVVPVQMGKASLSIDFARISRVVFLRQGDELLARVSFADGQEKTVTASPRTVFFGRTPWGLMRLAAKDIKEIRF